ncbi:MAG: NAD(P)H-dependent oxidoreductase [Planctomycetota bacterium]|jgi:NAD(P)H dehydrogenase (quinone)|nr:Trp repressor-binding protein [Deltaproteobacteria bacterium]MDP6540017.1 NAD(P)H-dependent oxidoreductase [Planctomycetota bacterium]
MRILVVVASQTGRTKRMAEAFAEGAREREALVEIVASADAGEDQVLGADALVLGSGVHMGGMESSMRVFFERMAPLWMQGRLVGKVGAAFASAGLGGRGGAELTLISLLANLAEHGMLLVPMHGRLDRYASGGCHWGPVAWTGARAEGVGPSDDHLAAARDHGRWVAECTGRWLAGA